MPYAVVTSNVAEASVDYEGALLAISKAVSTALGKPETYVMVQLNLGARMAFHGTLEPCAMIAIHSIGKIDPTSNAKTAAQLTETVSKALNVPVGRIFMNFDDVERSNWAMGGNTF
ncbi:hypothetical protein Poli38472_008005 [Pythium oligandrum]|uniref:L-dopachrome isomerase n=1 Tax=Pythium oligandrum TaxID=41045 RepID=A0A8K1CN69_PYTOL|nr:hypothetical protein Poli38472_008005 [Pythium oligandrum]|eukprot:TMW65363.1 hypothetical protein Poli38472_008005 [Pythium oligandrum]